MKVECWGVALARLRTEFFNRIAEVLPEMFHSQLGSALRRHPEAMGSDYRLGRLAAGVTDYEATSAKAWPAALSRSHARNCRQASSRLRSSAAIPASSMFRNRPCSPR